MKTLRLLTTGTALLLLLPLVGCDVDTDRETDGDVEIQAQVDQQKLEEAKQQTEEGLERAGDTLERAGRKIEAGVEKASEELEPYAKDAAITAKVKARLTADPEIDPITIDVDTVNGIVTLTGTVPDASDRDLALAHARSVEGVREVKDNLQIGERTGPTAG